ncbi:MarR family winged helix-turn-helix transcriptional regulator [Corynebacterium nuruki]|nr:MarR family transcriptional regulator [Corynebacterium nuruki]
MSILRERIPHLMRLILQDHSTRWAAQIPELTKTQYAVLKVIQEQPSIEQNRAAALAGTDRSTIADMLSRLENQGLVRRTVAAEDRRRRALTLTEQGSELLRATIDRVSEVDHSLLEPLTADEQETLSRLLRKILDAR